MGFDIKNTKGFTLVEMAIILMILGVLVSVGAGMMGALTKRLKLNETREAVKNASESIIGFSASTRRIPVEGNFTSTVTVAKDSWAKAIHYIPAPSITTDSICGRKTTGMSLSVCPDKACSAPTQSVADVAYVIISGGENFNIQTALVRGMVRVYDVGIGPVDDYAADMSRAEPYDDVVRWVTLYELRAKAGCSGPQMRIINKDLPSAIDKDHYSAEVFADGGVPFVSGGKYRWCVETQVQTINVHTVKTPVTPVQSKPTKHSKQPHHHSAKHHTSKAWLKTRPSKILMDKNCMGLPENKWGQSHTLILEGAAAAGTTGLTVFVRDDNDRVGHDDNIVSRAFVITVGK